MQGPGQRGQSQVLRGRGPQAFCLHRTTKMSSIGAWNWNTHWMLCRAHFAISSVAGLYAGGGRARIMGENGGGIVGRGMEVGGNAKEAAYIAGIPSPSYFLPLFSSPCLCPLVHCITTEQRHVSSMKTNFPYREANNLTNYQDKKIFQSDILNHSVKTYWVVNHLLTWWKQVML